MRSRDEPWQLVEAFTAMAARFREVRRTDHAKLVLTQKSTQTAINSLPDAVAVSFESAVQVFLDGHLRNERDPQGILAILRDSER